MEYTLNGQTWKKHFFATLSNNRKNWFDNRKAVGKNSPFFNKKEEYWKSSNNKSYKKILRISRRHIFGHKPP